MVERNMCNAVMRGIVVPPGSRATSRANRSRRNLGYLVTGRHCRVRGTVRVGKVRSRSGARCSRQLCLASVLKRLLPLDEATAVSSKVS
jgi:hypothetical protein